MEQLRRSPLYAQQQALGARFVPFAGWEMPVQYQGVAAEHEAARQRAGLFDVSHMGELWIEGPDAITQANLLITGDLAAKANGSALYTLCCNAEGGILDDLIVYRISDERVLIVCNAANYTKIRDHVAQHVGGASQLVDRTADTALLAIQGPKAVEVVCQVLQAPNLQTSARFSIQEVHFAGHSVWAARTGYSGEDGFELAIHNAAAPALWDALLHEGATVGLEPIGLGARDTLRLEAALRLYGNDMDEQTNPYEAGLGRTVKLSKSAFIGQDALRRLKAAGPTRRLVGFEMIGRGIARAGYPILDAQGSSIGQVTSGAPALALDKRVGLGYVPTAASQVGTPIQIEIRGKAVEAVICSTPFYRRSE